uniref:Vacuolar-sorting protein SNF8 n=1 Tax=Taeniopygia guttata TaxID=59729 RepID=A0A674HA51_TAEGU
AARGRRFLLRARGADHEVCLALRHRNGGLITLEELQAAGAEGPREVRAGRQRETNLLRAIKKLKVLGSGFGIIPVGGTVLVQSVPCRAQHGPHGAAAAGREKGICDSQRDPGQPQLGDGASEAGAGAPAEGGHGLAGRAGSGRAAVLAARALLRAPRPGRRRRALTAPGILGNHPWNPRESSLESSGIIPGISAGIPGNPPWNPRESSLESSGIPLESRLESPGSPPGILGNPSWNPRESPLESRLESPGIPPGILGNPSWNPRESPWNPLRSPWESQLESRLESSGIFPGILAGISPGIPSGISPGIPPLKPSWDPWESPSWSLWEFLLEFSKSWL